MSGYFQPRRRKFGLVALLVACALTAGWVRSFVISESVFSKSSLFFSHQGNLFAEVDAFAFDPDLRYQVVSVARNRYSNDSLWHWKGFGFALSFLGTSAESIVALHFPYWSIVIPLTLLSSYLLLSKPRAPKSGPSCA